MRSAVAAQILQGCFILSKNTACRAGIATSPRHWVYKKGRQSFGTLEKFLGSNQKSVFKFLFGTGWRGFCPSGAKRWISFNPNTPPFFFFFLFCKQDFCFVFARLNFEAVLRYYRLKLGFFAWQDWKKGWGDKQAAKTETGSWSWNSNFLPTFPTAAEALCGLNRRISAFGRQSSATFVSRTRKDCLKTFKGN